ncbi:MAG TPA: sialidase family protein [Holophagaceae bacterium]|nr:sialidase family protein [Holophagaceae bacterium]
MANIQVTHDLSPNNARSESSLAINPGNPLQMVAGSKKFTNPATYDFILATSYSTDAGQTWHDSQALQLLPGWAGISDPALTWDDAGHVFLLALPFAGGVEDIVGIAVYKSTDGGQTWNPPTLIHQSAGDDKQWMAADLYGAFPGHIYAAWDDGANMRFARSVDHGATWKGLGNDPVGTILANDSFAPEINVAANGNIYIAWRAGNQMKLLTSIDGGETFLPAVVAASGITTLDATLPKVDGWPVFPGGTFRVLTLPTACAGKAKTVAIAWADTRQGPSRIYYALSHNAGQSWVTSPSGDPLVTAQVAGNLQHFHPQLAANPNGVIGCAFYEFGPKPSAYKIDTLFADSGNNGASFHDPVVVTDQPWDPAVDAPFSHGDPNVTFIGDYFGLDASSNGFYPLWTDTRTGIQELFTDVVAAHVGVAINPKMYEIVEEILFGVTQDGPGLGLVGGHVVKHGPWDPDGPVYDILFGLACQRLATQIRDKEGIALQRSAMNLVARLAIAEVQRLEGQELAVGEVRAKRSRKMPAFGFHE